MRRDPVKILNFDDFDVFCHRDGEKEWAEVWIDDQHVCTPPTHNEEILKHVVVAYKTGVRDGREAGVSDTQKSIISALGL